MKICTGDEIYENWSRTKICSLTVWCERKAAITNNVDPVNLKRDLKCMHPVRLLIDSYVCVCVCVCVCLSVCLSVSVSLDSRPGPEVVVCDEGHVLRNIHSGLSGAVRKLATHCRLVLTGTPLQNNLKECKFFFLGGGGGGGAVIGLGCSLQN